MSEAESYHEAQKSAVELSGIRGDKTEKLKSYKEQFKSFGMPEGTAGLLAEYKMSGNRTEARRVIRKSLEIGKMRKEAGWKSEGAIASPKTAAKALEMFRSSRRKKDRRKRKGVRK